MTGRNLRKEVCFGCICVKCFGVQLAKQTLKLADSSSGLFHVPLYYRYDYYY